jgi:two-component system response regulator YesN
MYSVMIVDDDRIVSDDLSTLINWEQYGFFIQTIKSNGMRALESLSQKQPDVIFTDIKMPAMDGIELLKAVREKYPNIVVIMMSSYSEFSYAKEAITNGCFDYLLKDELNRDTLSQLLTKTKTHLESIHSATSSALEHQLKEFFLNPKTDIHSLNLIDRHPEKTYYYIKCDIDAPYPLIYWKVSHIERHFEFSAHESRELKSVSNPDFNIHHIIELSDFSFMIELEALTGKYHPINELTALIRQLQNVYSERFKKSFSAFYCGRKLSRTEAAVLFTDQTINTMNRYFLGTGLFMDINDPLLKAQTVNKKLDYDALDRLMKQNDSNGIVSLVDSWLSEIESLHDLNGLNELIDGCLFLLTRYEQKNNMISILPEANAENCLTCAGIRLWMHQLFQIYFKKLSISSGISPEIRSAINYINEHIGDKDLKIQRVANAVGLSYTWFSSMFKKETGQTFNNFLLNARIEYAKYLLDKKACKIYEVAEISGFRDSQYFSKVFKKIVGMTPTDYYKK